MFLVQDRLRGDRAQLWLLRAAATPDETAEIVLGELSRAASFRNVGAATLLGFGVQSGRVFAVYEDFSGSTLSLSLQSGKSRPLRDAIAIVSSAAIIVENVMAAQIAHPGLTPRNVYVNNRGDVGVYEIGFPALIRALPAADRETPTIASYVRAPEQEPGHSATVSAQVYAAGSILFWLVAGRPPFVSETTAALRALHRTSSPPSVRSFRDDIPLIISATIARSLAKDPSDRFPTLAAFRTALRLDSGLSPSHETVSYPVQLPSPTVRATVPSRTQEFWLPSDTTPVALPDSIRTRAYRTPDLVAKPRRQSLWPWAGMAALIVLGLLICGILAALGPTALEMAGVIPVGRTSEPSAQRSATARPGASPTGSAGQPSLTPGSSSPVGSPRPSSEAELASLYAAAAGCWDRDWPCVISNLEAVVARNAVYRDAGSKLTSAYISYGIQLARASQLSPAIVQFDKALALDPPNASAKRERMLAAEYLAGVRDYDTSNWKSAAAHFEIVLSEQRDYLAVVTLAYASHVNEGLRLLNAGDRINGRRECERAKAINPNGSEAAQCLSRADELAATPTAPPAPTSTVAPATPQPTSTPQPPTPIPTATQPAPTVTPAPPASGCFNPTLRGTGNSNNGYVQVAGMVVDRNGKGISNVLVEADAGGTVVRVRTGGDGAYSLGALGRGIYIMRMTPPTGTAGTYRIDASNPQGVAPTYQLDWREGGC